MLLPICRLHWYEPRERGCRRDLSWLKVRICSAHAYNKVFLYYQELRSTANVCSFLVDSAMNFSGPALPGCLRLVPGLWQAFTEHVILFLEVKCSVIYVSSCYITFQWYESKVNPSQWILCYKNEGLIPQQIFNTWTQFCVFPIISFPVLKNSYFLTGHPHGLMGVPRVVLNGLQWVTSKSNRDPHLK